MQLATSDYAFNLIRETRLYGEYTKYATEYNLVRDICTPADPKTIEDYIFVIQKSDKWLELRAAAQATASSIGKYIKSPTRYPTDEQLTEVWREKILNAPFKKTHAMTGHMKWGVTYEEVALTHFAVENTLCVVQVGTIRVPLDFIYGLCPVLCAGLLCEPGEHLLISPDGIVQSAGYTGEGIAPVTRGMLEIKCISPFHHIEIGEHLKWVDDMERRQWHKPEEIPFGYIIQICLQAISGYYRLDMNGDHVMWFMRWSPKGFSEFQIPFKDLIELGVVATAIYFSVYRRIKATLDLPFKYNAKEMALHKKMTTAYDEVCAKMVHRYVCHKDLYPEFNTYKMCTEFFKFQVRD